MLSPFGGSRRGIRGGIRGGSQGDPDHFQVIRVFGMSIFLGKSVKVKGILREHLPLYNIKRREYEESMRKGLHLAGAR